jgi:hypothetical protein
MICLGEEPVSSKPFELVKIVLESHRQTYLISEAQHCQWFPAGLPQMLFKSVFLCFLRVNRYILCAL